MACSVPKLASVIVHSLGFRVKGFGFGVRGLGLGPGAVRILPILGLLNDLSPQDLNTVHSKAKILTSTSTAPRPLGFRVLGFGV